MKDLFPFLFQRNHLPCLVDMTSFRLWFFVAAVCGVPHTAAGLQWQLYMEEKFLDLKCFTSAVTTALKPCVS